MVRKPIDPVTKELEAIKKLLILDLVASGVQAKDVAKVLGITKSALSAIVPARGIKRKRSNNGG